MLNKNYLSDNKNLKTEVSEPFHIRMKKEKPELSESVDLLMDSNFPHPEQPKSPLL